MTIDELRLELEQERMINATLLQRVKACEESINCAAIGFGRFIQNIDAKSHYLNQEELKLYRDKGLEALFIHWRKEIRKIDQEGMKKYDFALPQ